MINLAKWNIGNRNLVIWGLGLNGVKCTYLLRNHGIKVDFYLTSDKKVERFCGRNVFELSDKKRDSECFVLIATKLETYPIIKEKLIKHGFTEFRDFIHYEWLYKKIVLLHGNCHMLIIGKYLLSSQKFKEEFSFYPNPLVHHNKTGISKEVCRHIDVWIHEDIRENNERGYYVSDAWIRQNLSQTAIDIIIPHLFGLGGALFPQSCTNNNNMPIANGQDYNGMFPHGDMVIDNLLQKGKGIEEIISICKSNDAMDKELIIDNYCKCLEKIRIREEAWDIKIYDFIEKNIHNMQLFLDPGHPTNFVFKYISDNIMKKLGFENELVYCDEQLDTHEEPIYPVVKKVLGLNWEKTYIRESDDAKKCMKMDFAEYIREYIFWKSCYENN